LLAPFYLLVMGVEEMLVVFDSKTGNVRRFIEALDIEAIQISDSLIVNEPFVLVTYTTGFGLVPPSTTKFLESNHIYLQGVAASGNRNWGDMFARSADKISSMYGVPIIHKFEMSGLPRDVITFKERVQEIRYETHRIEQRGDTTKRQWLLQIGEG
jgi:protein involved in ribonucleotide reduction